MWTGQPASGRYASLTVAGRDLITEAPLDWEGGTIRWSDTGGAWGHLTWAIEDTAANRTLPGGADVRLTIDGTTVFGGTLLRRRFARLAGGARVITCEAVSYDSWLDWRIAVRWASRTDLGGRIRRLTSDGAMVRDVVNRRAPMLEAPAATVATTNSSMGIVRAAGKTVREVIELIGDEAQTVASPEARHVYVDERRRVHYYKATEGNAAPYRVADGSYVRDVITTSGLVEYWSLREESGTTCYGGLGYADLTRFGGWTLGVAAGVVNEPAYRAVTLDGSADYGSASGASLHPGDTFSLECWFKRSTLATAQAVLSAGTGDYELGFSAADKIVLIKEGTGDNFVSTSAYTDTSWHHLAVTRSPGTTTVYVDGASIAGTPTARTFVAAAGALNVGRRLSLTDRYFSGSLAHVAIYSSALSAATVLAHYQQGLSITPEGLLLDDDWGEVVHHAYVRGRTGKGSGWAYNRGSDFQLGAIQAFIEREGSNTTSRRRRAGRAFLQRHQRARGATFSTQQAAAWRAGQLLYVTDDALGLAGDAFEIRSVSGELGAGSTLTYDMELGVLRRSLMHYLRRRRRAG